MIDNFVPAKKGHRSVSNITDLIYPLQQEGVEEPMPWLKESTTLKTQSEHEGGETNPIKGGKASVAVGSLRCGKEHVSSLF